MSEFETRQTLGWASGAAWLESPTGRRFQALLQRANKLDAQGRPLQAVKSRERADQLLEQAQVPGGGLFGTPKRLDAGEKRCIYRTQGVEFL